MNPDSDPLQDEQDEAVDLQAQSIPPLSNAQSQSDVPSLQGKHCQIRNVALNICINHLQIKSLARLRGHLKTCFRVHPE